MDVNSQNQIKESFSQLSDLAINLKESAENLNSIINSNEIKINDIVSNVDNFSSNFSSLSNSFSDVELIIGNLTKTSNNLNSIIDIPALVYTSPGYYDISLIAKDNFGCSDTLQINNLVYIPGPILDFSIDQIFGCDSLQISYLTWFFF